MELWKPTDDENRKDTSEHTVRTKVERHRLVADKAVVVRKFHPGSFGYRPGRSAHDAVDQCAKSCRERWLKAPVCNQAGELVTRSKGTPQGGVISPLLANLYLHEAFDWWMAETQPRIAFERYADDIVIHTRSREQSDFILDKIKVRLAEYSLEVHPEKTKTVYCYRTARFYKGGKDMPVSFDFLGFTFKPRLCAKPNGEKFWGFRPAISSKSRKKIIGKLRELAIQNWVFWDIQKIAAALAPMIRGWIHYYGRYRISELQWVFRSLNSRLAKWARKLYKLRTYAKSYGWLKRMIKWYPNTFVHWTYGFTG
ncbi:MAG TPA: reverse transcriptase domain-containing protein [Bacteroidales bacterium]|jgi:hypothetical protein|nr:hypothetical protein [Bacteroidales bacterium]MBP8999102.1 hypothetical protein [Bacteroidales bacterium]MCZ2317651.1 hypothetical protein [Bacteroidales bacterium]HOT55281.1 reverse transcriptase domain-containing protein [Bacteroidales bacterium]HQM99196.1 reverse transcriptase domain-containing protein [Bacteroidales bacterium]